MSFDCLHLNELTSFDYFLNVLFSFHKIFNFYFQIKVLPLKCI